MPHVHRMMVLPDTFFPSCKSNTSQCLLLHFHRNYYVQSLHWKIQPWEQQVTPALVFAVDERASSSIWMMLPEPVLSRLVRLSRGPPDVLWSGCSIIANVRHQPANVHLNGGSKQGISLSGKNEQIEAQRATYPRLEWMIMVIVVGYSGGDAIRQLLYVVLPKETMQQLTMSKISFGNNIFGVSIGAFQSFFAMANLRMKLT